MQADDLIKVLGGVIGFILGVFALWGIFYNKIKRIDDNSSNYTNLNTKVEKMETSLEAKFDKFMLEIKADRLAQEISFRGLTEGQHKRELDMVQVRAKVEYIADGNKELKELVGKLSEAINEVVRGNSNVQSQYRQQLQDAKKN